MIDTTLTCNEVLHAYIMYIRRTINIQQLNLIFNKNILKIRNSKNHNNIAYNTILYNNNSITKHIDSYQKYNYVNNIKQKYKIMS